VTFLAEDGGPAGLGSVHISTTFRSSSLGAVYQSIVIPEGDVVTLRRLEGDDVLIDVNDERQRPLLSTVVPLEAREGDVQRVSLRLGGARVRVRVVDPGGVPVVGARLAVLDTSGALPRSMRAYDSGLDGDAVIGPTRASELSINLTHPALGSSYGHVVRLSGDPDQHALLVFDAPASIELRLRDGTTPLPQVDVTLFHPSGESSPVGTKTSDAIGGVAFAQLSPDTYRARVSQPGLWPTEADVVASPAGTPATLQVRRLGSLALTARNAQGLVVPGVPVSLASLELGADVAAWIQAGLVVSPPQGMQTGADGTLRLADLPNGSYAWRAYPASGAVLEGTLLVPPLGEGSASILLH
jgi:hypothetical protein